MFDVYLNDKRDRLLVIARGQPIPAIENARRWRKKKATVAVSDEIKSAIQRDGFYWRSLRKSNSLPSKKTTRRPSRRDSGTCHDAGPS
jgi:hypothetical protein